MSEKLNLMLGPEDVNHVRAQMQRDLYGRHTKTHTTFGKPMAYIRKPDEFAGRHQKRPSWLDDFIAATYEYAEQTSAENISRSSDDIVVPARRRGFELDMLVMDEADRLNDE